MLSSYLLFRAIVTQLVECNLAKVKAKGSNPFICLHLIVFGWMAEWFKAIVLKTVVFNRYRGFESHSILFARLNNIMVMCEIANLKILVQVRF